MTSAKGKSYSSDFKLNVISKDELFGNREDDKQFSVDKKGVRD